jgi:hypothetical protein
METNNVTCMSTCSPNLRHSFFAICEITMFKVNNFFSSPMPKGNTVHEGWFRQTSAEIEFPCQIFTGPHHPKPITRCHVALFDKI